jgi:hypothetical protein
LASEDVALSAELPTNTLASAPSENVTRLGRVAKIRRICYLALMAEKSCRVTVSDLNGTAHTVQITASTLYEAVARGLAAIRGNEWVAGIAQGLNVVKASVATVPNAAR